QEFQRYGARVNRARWRVPQLAAQDLDQQTLIEATDVDKSGTQRPSSRGLRRQPPLELLLGEQAALDQHIAELAPISGEQLLPREGMCGLVPADPLARPQVLKIVQRGARHSEVVYDVGQYVARHDERKLRPSVDPACPEMAMRQPVSQ